MKLYRLTAENVLHSMSDNNGSKTGQSCILGNWATVDHLCRISKHCCFELKAHNIHLKLASLNIKVNSYSFDLFKNTR